MDACRNPPSCRPWQSPGRALAVAAAGDHGTGRERGGASSTALATALKNVGPGPRDHVNGRAGPSSPRLTPAYKKDRTASPPQWARPQRDGGADAAVAS